MLVTCRPRPVPDKARVVGGRVSEDLFERGLCLPSGTQMNEEDLERVVEVIKKARVKVVAHNSVTKDHGGPGHWGG